MKKKQEEKEREKKMYITPSTYWNPTVAPTVTPVTPIVTTTTSSNLPWILAIGGAILVVVILAVSMMGTQEPHTLITPTVVHGPVGYVNPNPVYDYFLDSPSMNGDLQSILRYLLQRGTYAATGERLSDDAITALKNATGWRLSSASPPIWYYRSWDNLHSFQLVWSTEFGVWIIQPAL